MNWIDAEKFDPPIAGKYVVETVGTGRLYRPQTLEATFTPGSNGKRGAFDVHNQKVVRWLEEPTERKMSTLSKAQRNDVYRRLLEKSSRPRFSRSDFEPLAKDSPGQMIGKVPGFCWALDHMGHCVYEDRAMEETFPELHAAKPPVLWESWWWKPGDWTMRNEVLRKAIERTE